MTESKFPKYVITKTNLHAGWWNNGVMPMLVSFGSMETTRAMVDDLQGLDKNADWKACADFVLEVASNHRFTENGNYVLGLPLPHANARAAFEVGVLIHDDQLNEYTIGYFRRLGETLTRAGENPRAVMMESAFGHRIELFPVVEPAPEIDGTKDRATGAPIGVAIAITSPTYWDDALSADGELLKPVPMLVLFRERPRPCDVAIETNNGWLYWSVPKMLGEKLWTALLTGRMPNEEDKP
ncbi:hypothetical protein EKK58_05270 [Candidatus Dependentiae bacterium]|nr:MAG: hypothetical protein EKK58_05270 [Candidatus Dependentiae bacterium]